MQDLHKSPDSESSEDDESNSNSDKIKKVTFKFEDYIEFCNNYYDKIYIGDKQARVFIEAIIKYFKNTK